jgi:hypothetical protein
MREIVIIDRRVDSNRFDMVEVFVTHDQRGRDRGRTFTSEGSAEERGIFHGGRNKKEVVKVDKV